jgi:hypothetical protein
MKHFFIPLFAVAALVFAGCGGGSDGNGGGGNGEEYSVVLYDNNLEYKQTLTLPGGKDVKGSLPSGYLWYYEEKPESITSLVLTGDVTLYSLPNVHKISNETDLNNVRHNLNHNYILLNDIELDSAVRWLPIGDSGTNSFSGVFNGNGNKIEGLYINITSSDDTVYAGLFGYLKGNVRNLGVELDAKGISISVSDTVHAGGIAGRVTQGIIVNSYTAGDGSITISSSSSSAHNYSTAGGIVGHVDVGVIMNTHSTVDVTANSSNSAPFTYATSHAGGIVGDVNNAGIIANSYSTGNIKSDSSDYFSYAGGIAGELNALTSIGGEPSAILNSYSTGDIAAATASASSSDYSYAGGITGRVRQSTIDGSYSKGVIKATGTSSKAGGIAGYADSGSEIEGCAAINPSISGVTVKRVAGDTFSAALTNNFANKDMRLDGSTVTETDANDKNGADKDLSLFQEQDTYKTGLGWQFGDDDDNPWKMPPSSSEYTYPILYWQP